MSRTIDKLKKLSQKAPAPMGFRTAKITETPPPLMIIGRTAVKATATTGKTDSGVDAILVYSGKVGLSAANVRKTVEAFGDIPWGVYLEESGEITGALVEAGCDFVMFSPTARVSDLPQDEKVGKIVEVDSSMDNGLLRAINDLPADAVLVTDAPGKSDRLVWHQLMIYRHLATFITKPMIVPVSANISEAELKALQDSEIDGVIAELDGEKLKELRKTVSKLPARSAKKREKGVLLPRAASESTTTEPPDEEEEE
jgi:hypothetical protein